MLIYRPFELHCHTRHSDGTFTVPELFRDAAEYGYRGVALTDHNAVSGAEEITPDLERVTLTGIRGIEWTTFYGHMLVLGCRDFVDWRFVRPDTIDAALAEIRAAGGVSGIAHPCEVGAPLMCGCHWDFQVTRWDLLDYVEIWSETDPHARTKNRLALPWYDRLLNAGHRLAVSAGRDWHGPDRPGVTPLLTATYLGIEAGSGAAEPVTEQQVLAALRAGRSYVSLGVRTAFQFVQNGKICGVGDCLRAGTAALSVRTAGAGAELVPSCPEAAMETAFLSDGWAGLTRNGAVAERIRLVHNGQTAGEWTAPAVSDMSVVLEPGWCRIEIYGRYAGGQAGLLALTSPVYIE